MTMATDKMVLTKRFTKDCQLCSAKKQLVGLVRVGQQFFDACPACVKKREKRVT